jgi:hypothetical protein
MWRESVKPLFNKVQGQHLKNQVGHNFGLVSRFDIIPRDSIKATLSAVWRLLKSFSIQVIMRSLLNKNKEKYVVNKNLELVQT